MTRPFLLTGILGILTFAASLWLNQPIKGQSYKCPDGFSNPALGMELMRNPTDFAPFFGADPAEKELKTRNMLEMLHRDNVFVLVYVLLLLSFLSGIFMQEKKPFYLLLMALPILAGLSDFIENFQQISMISNFRDSGAPPQQMDITRMLAFAWSKWLLLLLLFFGIGRYLRQTNWLGKILGYLPVLGLFLAIPGILGYNQVAQLYCQLILLVMLPLLLLFAFTYKKQRVA